MEMKSTRGVSTYIGSTSRSGTRRGNGRPEPAVPEAGTGRFAVDVDEEENEDDIYS